MKPIIALTDFSPISLNAVNYASDMAVSLEADLSLLHIILLPFTFSDVPYPPEHIDELMKGAEQEVVILKEKLVKRTGGKIRIDTSVSTGSIILETEDHCKTKDAYAVIMGTLGTNALERTFLGSNTLGLIKQLSWPLLVIPPEAKFGGLKKIGLACDLKKVDDTIPFSAIRSFVKKFNAELHIMHVSSESHNRFSGEVVAESRSLRNGLSDLQLTYDFLENDDIESGLSKFAKSNELDLLIVIPKKHNLIDRLLHKSQSKQLVIHTDVPVMSLHE